MGSSVVEYKGAVDMKSCSETTGERGNGFSNGLPVRLMVMCRLAALLVVILTSAVAPNACVEAAPAPPVPDGAQLYSVNCVVCHGEDGKGTETGKSLNAVDLGSDAVQKQTNAMLAQAISEGKNNMPPFMSTLSKADIQGLVIYVRTIGKKKK
jgi:mono/diheme cytochrome c family protein